jgi:hypothetical protein
MSRREAAVAGSKERCLRSASPESSRAGTAPDQSRPKTIRTPPQTTNAETRPQCHIESGSSPDSRCRRPICVHRASSRHHARGGDDPHRHRCCCAAVPARPGRSRQVPARPAHCEDMTFSGDSRPYCVGLAVLRLMRLCAADAGAAEMSRREQLLAWRAQKRHRGKENSGARYNLRQRQMKPLSSSPKPNKIRKVHNEAVCPRCVPVLPLT